jgi:hypothetical protein
MKKPNNPDLYKGNIQLTEDRVTLRDYFAAKAMQGMISNQSMYSVTATVAFKNLSVESYMIADEMLKQREL